MQIQFEKKLRPIKNSILNSLLVAQWKKNAQDRRRILIGGFDSSPAATLDETWQQANPASQPIRKAGRQGRHTLESTNFPIRLRVLACPLGSRKSSLGPDFCLGQLLARRDWSPWARARAPLVFPLERLVSCWTGSQESCVCLTWRRQLVTGWCNRAREWELGRAVQVCDRHSTTAQVCLCNCVQLSGPFILDGDTVYQQCDK